jgi:hypothetical protein
MAFAATTVQHSDARRDEPIRDEGEWRNAEIYAG